MMRLHLSGAMRQDGQDMTIAGQIVQTIADSRARRSYPASDRAMLQCNSVITGVMFNRVGLSTLAHAVVSYSPR